MDRHELAWAAGFFDGEGWAGKSKRGVQAQINQAGPDHVPAALARFQAALGGLGRIGGPTREPKRKDMYRWVVSSRNDVELVLQLLKPWLGPVKLCQVARATGLAVSSAEARTGDDEWRAWAAGLFDGEGCSALLRHRRIRITRRASSPSRNPRSSVRRKSCGDSALSLEPGTSRDRIRSARPPWTSIVGRRQPSLMSNLS